MVVQRISELNIKSSGFIVPITGYIEDAFIDEDLCSYTFEHQLYLYLKKEGFDRIFFVNRARRRTFYTYEAEGFKSIENKNDNNIKGHGRSDGRLGGGRLSRLSKAQIETLNDTECKDLTGRKYYCRNNLLDSGLKKLIIDILSDKTMISAICFINQNFETAQIQDIVDSIALIDKDYAAACLKNKLIVNKNISGNLFNNPFFVEKLNSNVFQIATPDYNECKNWVNAKRIKGSFNPEQVFSFPFEDLVKRIYQKKKKISELEKELDMEKNNFIEGLKQNLKPFDLDLLKLELEKVKGQQDNMDCLAQMLSIWFQRINKQKPLVFMFAGTSGTGKTFTAKTIKKALSEYGYDFLRLNMNEYHNEGDTWKLLGSAPGFVGSNVDSPIFSAHKKSDKLVILFDEIEKAHPSLFTTIMTLMDEGELSDGKGQKYDFKNSVIIFTTNLAMDRLIAEKESLVTKGVSIESRDFQKHIRQILKDNGLRNEICGRIDSLLVFNTLDYNSVMQIALEEIRAKGKEYDIQINAVSPVYLKQIAEICSNDNEGARPISREIEKTIEPIIQNAIKTKAYVKDLLYEIDDNLKLIPSTSNEQEDVVEVIDVIAKGINKDQLKKQLLPFDIQLIESNLAKIKGQTDNMGLLSKSLTTWFRKKYKQKPLVFMFAGTSGTGKTFTAKTIKKALSEYGYDFLRLNMNEYHNEGDTWKLLGSAPGFVGSNVDSPIFSAHKKSDKLVILFDEIEKAHPSLFTTIMTLMDEGELSDGKGQKYDFKNSVIIFTTNLAMDRLIAEKESLVTKGVSIESRDFQKHIRQILKDNGLRNEICGRIDSLLVFNTLDYNSVMQIALEEIRAKGKEYDIQINAVSPVYLKQIAEICSNDNEGARPISREIEKTIEPKLQDAYELNDCSCEKMYDIDEELNIIQSRFDTMLSLEDILSN